MNKVGIVGYRGMVGSTLVERMKTEDDFKSIRPFFFSESQAGRPDPLGQLNEVILNSYDLELLYEMDIILTCQGSSYTQKIVPQLKRMGWKGYWIDASSALRMSDDSEIVLDPVNKDLLYRAIDSGVKVFSGGNCTVSLLLMAIDGLVKENLVEWVSSQTYQAASGAGAQHMIELFMQMRHLAFGVDGDVEKKWDALELDRLLALSISQDNFPNRFFQAALAMNVLPWIDEKMSSGQTREEWKSQVEAARILKGYNAFPIDGQCVRVGSFRSHAQAVTIKLKKDIDIKTVEQLLTKTHPWLKLIPNEREETLRHLTPVAVSRTLDVAVGRVRKMTLGDDFLGLFTVADQLLWGAAEPLRRMLKILLEVK